MKLETEKQRKIRTLLSLINGEITPSDILPSLLLKISPEGLHSCFINGKSVDEATFNKKLESQPAICNFRTIGRVDNSAEYYY